MGIANRRLHFRIAPKVVVNLFCGGQGFRTTIAHLSGETVRLRKPSEWRPTPGELCEVRFGAAGILYSFDVVAEIVWSSDQAVTMRLVYPNEQRDWLLARYIDGFKDVLAVNEPSFAAS